jgi:hypothetical protein
MPFSSAVPQVRVLVLSFNVGRVHIHMRRYFGRQLLCVSTKFSLARMIAAKRQVTVLLHCL